MWEATQLQEFCSDGDASSFASGGGINSRITLIRIDRISFHLAVERLSKMEDEIEDRGLAQSLNARSSIFDPLSSTLDPRQHVIQFIPRKLHVLGVDEYSQSLIAA